MLRPLVATLLVALPALGQAPAPIRIPVVALPAMSTDFVAPVVKPSIASLPVLAPRSNPEAWITSDTVLECIFVGSILVDWAQTLDGNRHYTQSYRYWDVQNTDGSVTRYGTTSPPYEEMNHVLGSRPSRAAINRYEMAVLGGHYLLARALPRRWRGPFQYLSLGVEAYAIGGNARCGLRVAF